MTILFNEDLLPNFINALHVDDINCIEGDNYEYSH